MRGYKGIDGLVRYFTLSCLFGLLVCFRSGQGKSVGFDGVTQGEIRDEENYGKVKKYESKIDTLMSEAGQLQTQLDLQKVKADAER